MDEITSPGEINGYTTGRMFRFEFFHSFRIVAAPECYLDKGINLYFLDKPGPVSPEDFFIALRLDDGGNGIIKSFPLPFAP